MLNPELGELYDVLTGLAEHASAAGVVIEDEDGYRYELVRSFAVGAKTDDPGAVLKLRCIGYPNLQVAR